MLLEPQGRAFDRLTQTSVSKDTADRSKLLLGIFNIKRCKRRIACLTNIITYVDINKVKLLSVLFFNQRKLASAMTTLTNMPVEIECNSCTSVQVPEMPFVQSTAITGMQASISPDACRFASGDQGHFQNIDPRSMDCAIAFATPSRRMENAARQTPALLTMPHALRHYWVHKAKALLLNLFEGLK